MHAVHRILLLPTFIAAVIIAPGLSTAAEPEPEASVKKVRIVTIGNSFANNALMYLEDMAASMPGYEIEITRANLGGTSIKRHYGLMMKAKEDPDLKPYDDQFTLKDILE
ncbi:MAG: hypothetical protein PF795_10715 [Kiritimatiellae bacterium]|jgi:hypothetical protein|nr:hypothetical protein [Kiritimatiellia bacterium]